MKKTGKTITALARTLGVSRSTLYEWKGCGAPLEKGEGAVLAWAMRETKQRPDTDAMRDAKLFVLRETSRRLKTANDHKSQLLVPRAAVENCFAMATGILFHGLDRLAQELPQKLAGLAATETVFQVTLHADALKAVIRSAFAELAGEKIDEGEAFKAGAEVLEKYTVRAVGGKCFAERVEHEYQTFRRWLAEETKIRSEKRAEWLRLRAAAGLPVFDATPAEVAKYGVTKIEPVDEPPK